MDCSRGRTGSRRGTDNPTLTAMEILALVQSDIESQRRSLFSPPLRRNSRRQDQSNHSELDSLLSMGVQNRNLPCPVPPSDDRSSIDVEAWAVSGGATYYVNEGGSEFSEPELEVPLPRRTNTTTGRNHRSQTGQNVSTYSSRALPYQNREFTTHGAILYDGDFERTFARDSRRSGRRHRPSASRGVVDRDAPPEGQIINLRVPAPARIHMTPGGPPFFRLGGYDGGEPESQNSRTSDDHGVDGLTLSSSGGVSYTAVEEEVQNDVERSITGAGVAVEGGKDIQEEVQTDGDVWGDRAADDGLRLITNDLAEHGDLLSPMLRPQGGEPLSAIYAGDAGVNNFNGLAPVDATSNQRGLVPVSIGHMSVEPQVGDEGLFNHNQPLIVQPTAPSTSTHPVVDNEMSPNQQTEVRGIRKRNRFADPATWQVIQNQQKRLRGEEYIGRSTHWNEESGQRIKTVSDVVKPSRELKSPCKCKNKVTACNKISEASRKEIHNQYWKKATRDLKKSYVVSMVDRTEVQRRRKDGARPRNVTYNYHLKVADTRMKVCKTMFLKTLNIGKDQVHGWLEGSLHGIPGTRKIRPKKDMSACPRRKRLDEFLQTIPMMPSHYCRATSTKTYIQPHISSFMKLYRLYAKHHGYTARKEKHLNPVSGVKMRRITLHRDDGTPNTAPKPFSITAFRRIMEERKIGLFKPRKDQCDLCCSNQIGQFGDEAHRLHLEKAETARTAKVRDKENAIAGECHVITMDVEAVQLAPKLRASALYYKTKLMVHNFTIYDLVDGGGKCYWWDETEGDLTGSSFASCIVDYIKTKFPGTTLLIIIWSDGCTNQNRNVMLANALLKLAKETQITIVQKYLEKGHTQMECDSVHSTIETELKHKDIYVPEDYLTICRNARPDDPYEAVAVTHDFFLNYSRRPNQIYQTIRPGGGKAGPARVVDLRQIKYLPTGVIEYKLSHEDSEAWKPMPQKIFTPVSAECPKLHSSRLKITNRKYNDLKELLTVIPTQHHSFFKNLPHHKSISNAKGRGTTSRAIVDSSNLQDESEQLATSVRTIDVEDNAVGDKDGETITSGPDLNEEGLQASSDDEDPSSEEESCDEVEEEDSESSDDDGDSFEDQEAGVAEDSNEGSAVQVSRSGRVIKKRMPIDA